MPLTIGFAGLGNMGGPMLRRLLADGYAVRAFDIDADALAAAVADGAEAASSVADCAATADIFMTSLPRPEQVESVMLADGALAAMQTGSTWVDLTTNRPELVLEIAARADGVGVVDAPVTGAVDGARQGRLTLFAGGADADLERVVPVLESLGRVLRCGKLGTGNVTKLVTNQLWFVHAAALGEGFALGLANGVALDVLWEAIRHSVGDSFVAQHDAPSIFAGHYDPSFKLELCLKDLKLIDELAARVNTDLPMTERARETFVRAADRYGTDAGEMHVARRIEDDARIPFRLEGDWVPHWKA